MKLLITEYFDEESTEVFQPAFLDGIVCISICSKDDCVMTIELSSGSFYAFPFTDVRAMESWLYMLQDAAMHDIVVDARERLIGIAYEQDASIYDNDCLDYSLNRIRKKNNAEVRSASKVKSNGILPNIVYVPDVPTYNQQIREVHAFDQEIR